MAMGQVEGTRKCRGHHIGAIFEAEYGDCPGEDAIQGSASSTPVPRPRWSRVDQPRDAVLAHCLHNVELRDVGFDKALRCR